MIKKKKKKIVNIIFCVWIYHHQNFLTLLLFFTNFSFFFLAKFVLVKKCIIYLGVAAVYGVYKQLYLLRVEALKWPKIKQILSTTQAQIVPSLKECSSQYSVLIWIHIVVGNEKLCKIYFKKLFFQNVLAFIDVFYRYHISVISSTQIPCNVMCVQYVQKQPPEMFFKKRHSLKFC